jgi:hypothetical protein
MILWFIDRFGMPGSYYSIWLRACNDTGIQPKNVRAVSLHKVIPRQLLTKYANRKAPTWIPEAQPLIAQTINRLRQELKPEAIVLSSPESLCILGLSPEVATLHNLRGSVYWKFGVPHLVTLPISAWTTMVNQKDIGAANYGFESAEAMNQATENSNAKQGRNGNEIQKQSRQERSNPLHDQRQVHQQGRLASAPRQMGGRTDPSRGITSVGSERRFDGNQSQRAGSQSDSSLPADGQRAAEGSGLRDSNTGDRQQGRGTSESGTGKIIPGLGRGMSSEGVELGVPVDNRWTGVRDRLDLRPRHLMGETSESGGVGSSDDAEAERVYLDTDDKRFDSPADQQSVPVEFRVTGGNRQADRLDGSDGEDESDDGTDGGRSDDGDVPDDSEGDASEAQGIDGQIIGPEDDDQDRFFYEPVLSPVGRFTIIADYSKLARILQDGKAADGPAKPYHLRY